MITRPDQKTSQKTPRGFIWLCNHVNQLCDRTPQSANINLSLMDRNIKYYFTQQYYFTLLFK